MCILPSETPSVTLLGLLEFLMLHREYSSDPLTPPFFSQDPRGAWLSSLRSTYQKECQCKSMNRWAVTIRRLSGLNPCSWVQRRRLVCLSPHSCCNTAATCSNETALHSSSHTSQRPVPLSAIFSRLSSLLIRPLGCSPVTCG